MRGNRDHQLTAAGQGQPSRPWGVISLHEVYRVDEAKLRLGWSDAAYRAARRRGLEVLASGKRRYVTGQEILRFLIADSASAGPKAAAPRNGREPNKRL